MPTYEYRCPDGHEFEHFYRKISDAPKDVVCPVCSKPAERRLSAGAGLVFKGSGFYLTDYGKNAHRAGGPPASGEGNKSSDAGSGSKAGERDSTPGAPKTDAATSPGAKSEAGASGTSGAKASDATKPVAPANKSEPKPSGGTTRKPSKPDG
jgi:putative FmdB family regulatory protein